MKYSEASEVPINGFNLSEANYDSGKYNIEIKNSPGTMDSEPFEGLLVSQGSQQTNEPKIELKGVTPKILDAKSSVNSDEELIDFGLGSEITASQIERVESTNH